MSENTVLMKTIEKMDTAYAQKLGEELKNMVEDGTNHITLDMEDTIYICSMALRVFLKTQKSLEAREGTLVLRHVTTSVMEVFDVTGFSGLFQFEDRLS